MKLIPITSIRKKHYKGKVYDLTVKDNHSYNINNIIVHNSACTSSANGAINYPMGSLLYEINKIKQERLLENKFVSNIVADGGIRTFSDAIKCLAIGATHVMMGSILNKALESSGKTVDDSNLKVDQYNEVIKSLFKSGEMSYYKTYRGMSTKEVQRIISDKNNLRTAEGIIVTNKVEYTLPQWVDNFKDYLRSAMSYTNSLTLSDFIGNVQIKLITQQAFNRFNK